MMELDELKNSWLSLDDRLKKNEALEGRIIKEMLYKKSNKSLSKLLNFTLFGIIITILSLPCLIWIAAHGKYPEIMGYILIFWIIHALVGVIWEIKKLFLLMKIEFSKTVSNNIEFVQRYIICIKKGKMVSIFSLLMVAISYMIIGISKNADLAVWSFLFSVLIVAFVVSYWQYKKIYKSNIQSIKQSLEELKELDEE